jgi:hypothetical protein
MCSVVARCPAAAGQALYQNGGPLDTAFVLVKLDALAAEGPVSGARGETRRHGCVARRRMPTAVLSGTRPCVPS